MNLSELFWSKVGFGVIGFVAGSIWCFIIFPLFKIAYPELTLFPFYKVFVLAFVLGSLISEKFIGHAGFGAIYAIYGYFTVLLGVDTLSISDVNWSKIAKEVIVCLLIGVGAGNVTITWGQYAL